MHKSMLPAPIEVPIRLFKALFIPITKDIHVIFWKALPKPTAAILSASAKYPTKKRLTS